MRVLRSGRVLEVGRTRARLDLGILNFFLFSFLVGFYGRECVFLWGKHGYSLEIIHGCDFSRVKEIVCGLSGRSTCGKLVDAKISGTSYDTDTFVRNITSVQRLQLGIHTRPDLMYHEF